MTKARVLLETRASRLYMPGCTIPTHRYEVRLSVVPRRRGGAPTRVVEAACSSLSGAVRKAVAAFRAARDGTAAPEVDDFLQRAKRAFKRAG